MSFREAPLNGAGGRSADRRKAVVQSLLILFGLMLAAGLLMCGAPAGRYTRTAEEGEVIDPASFQHVSRPDYPIWRWFHTANGYYAGA